MPRAAAGSERRRLAPRCLRIAGALLVASGCWTLAVAKGGADPLDAADAACLDKAQSTADMANCENASYKRWDAELNRAYGELKKKLDASGQQALKDSQQKWLAFRDAELKTVGAVFDQLEGTMYIPMRAGAVRNVVKARAHELRDYLGLLADND